MVLQNLGNRIREERLRARLTQEQLAEIVGCNDSYIGQIERGNKNPSLEIIVCIANALNVTIDYLLSDSIKMDQADGMLEELISLASVRDKDDIRFLLTINRLIVEHLDKKKES